MDWLVSFFLITIGGMLLLWAIGYGLSWIIPTKFVDWYAHWKRDGFMDVMLTMAGQAFTFFLWLAVVQSAIKDGPIMVSAVELGEANTEIIIVGILGFIIFTIHAAMQWRILRRCGK